MSVQSEINRIQANIQSALGAIEGKGVTVPEDASTDELTGLIEAIPTGSDTSDATAAAGDILAGKTAYAGGEKLTGTMADHGAVSQTLVSGESYSIPAGYHNGEGSVQVQSLALQTQANASASDLKYQRTAWVNGKMLTGRNKYLVDTSDADAAAGDIAYGKSAYVTGAKVYGSMRAPSYISDVASSSGLLYPISYYYDPSTLTATVELDASSIGIMDMITITFGT